MTTSRQPWTVEKASNAEGTWIRAASGELIGAMRDWQDAELVINSISDPDQVEHWKSECEFAQEECELLEKKVKKLDEELEVANDRISELELKLEERD